MPDDPPRQIDATLIVRAQLGDRAAFRRLLERSAPRLRAHLLRILADPHDADDAFQDAAVLVWKRLYQLHEPAAYWAWAFRIATREARRHIRKRVRRRAEIPLPDDTPAQAPAEAGEGAFIDEEERRRLLERIEELSPNNREVVCLHYAEGFSIAGVAAILEIPDGTVKSRLSAALAKLRRDLAPKESHP